jgi:FtsZ-binding cell division protein ZapB
MSSLLEQAIVDAKALKEAAMKNAEATIIDKYSEEVKSTLNQLLEQDELGALLGGDEPSADAEGAMEEEVKVDEIAEGVPDAFTEDVAELDGVNEGDETEVTVDFAELAEALKQLREGVEEETLEESEEETLEEADEEPMDEELELDEESIMEMVASMLSEEDEEVVEEASCSDDEEVMEEGEEEEDLYEELSDDMLDAIMEKLTVDMGATLSGWAGRSSEDMKHQMELEMAHRRSTEVAEELEALKKAQEELVFENKKLKENLSNYQEVVNSLKENVQDVNLSNARLLYTNRTLRNTSLNERQKERIVEAISKAGSVEEAKTIHETLQSTVASTPARGPQSLSEAITRPTSIIRASRKEEPKADPFQARMRKLAGIK